MFSINRLIIITFNYFYIFWLFLISWTAVKPIQLLPWLFIHQVLFFGISKIFIKISFTDLFCWFLNSVYHISWISVNLSWNFSSGVIANCQWEVSKPDIRIWLPCMFVEGSGEGDSSCDCTCCNKYNDWIQDSYSSYSLLQLCR